MNHYEASDLLDELLCAWDDIPAPGYNKSGYDDAWRNAWEKYALKREEIVKLLTGV